MNHLKNPSSSLSRTKIFEIKKLQKSPGKQKKDDPILSLFVVACLVMKARVELLTR